MNRASTDAIAGVGVIGPNAVTRMAEALRASGGESLCRRIFIRAGLSHYLATPPTRMIPETDVAILHRAAIGELGEAGAAVISREAGRLTGDYLLAHRIPTLAQRVLKKLPRGLAARLLVAGARVDLDAAVRRGALAEHRELAVDALIAQERAAAHEPRVH